MITTDDYDAWWRALCAPNDNVDSATPEVLLLGCKSTGDPCCFRFGIWESFVPHRHFHIGSTRELLETAEPDSEQKSPRYRSDGADNGSASAHTGVGNVVCCWL